MGDEPLARLLRDRCPDLFVARRHGFIPIAPCRADNDSGPGPDISSPYWAILPTARRFARRSAHTDTAGSARSAIWPAAARPRRPNARPSDCPRVGCPRMVILQAVAARLPHRDPGDLAGVVPAARAPSLDCWLWCRGSVAGRQSLPDRLPATSANRPPEPGPERRISL